MSEPPKVNSQHLLVYLIKRLDEHERKLEHIASTSSNLHHDFQRSSRRNDIITAIALVVKAGWVFSAQLSMFFMAGYVAIEHQWYVQKVWTWISTVLSLH
jgi:hypothetical protein